MGFIGTVIGVSTAIAGLAGSLENASDVSAIKGALNNVFAGLGTAFDTTLLAVGSEPNGKSSLLGITKK